MAAVANRLMQNIRLNAKSFLQERRYTAVQSRSATIHLPLTLAPLPSLQ